MVVKFLKVSKVLAKFLIDINYYDLPYDRNLANILMATEQRK